MPRSRWAGGRSLVTHVCKRMFLCSEITGAIPDAAKGLAGQPGNGCALLSGVVRVTRRCAAVYEGRLDRVDAGPQRRVVEDVSVVCPPNMLHDCSGMHTQVPARSLANVVLVCLEIHSSVTRAAQCCVYVLLG